MKHLALAIGLLLAVASNLADGFSLRERLAQQRNETKQAGSSDDAAATTTGRPNEQDEEESGPTLLLKEADIMETNCTGGICNTTEKLCECSGVCEYVFSQDPCFCKRDWHCHDTSIVNRTRRGGVNSTSEKPVAPPISAEDPDDDTDHDDDDNDDDNSKEKTSTTRTRRDATDSERDARRKDNDPINCQIQSCSPNHGKHNSTTDSHNSGTDPHNSSHGKHNSTNDPHKPGTDSHNSSHGKHNSTNDSHHNGARDQPIATPLSPQGSRARRGADESKTVLDHKASNANQSSTTSGPALSQDDAKNSSHSKVSTLGPRTTRGAADAKQDSNSKPAPQPAHPSSQDDDDDDDDDDDTTVSPKTTRTRRGTAEAKPDSNKNVTNSKPTPQPAHPPTTPKTTRTRRGTTEAKPDSSKNVTNSKPTPQPAHPPTNPKTTRTRRDAAEAKQDSTQNAPNSKPAPQPAHPSSQEDDDGDDDTTTVIPKTTHTRPGAAH